MINFVECINCICLWILLLKWFSFTPRVYQVPNEDMLIASNTGSMEGYSRNNSIMLDDICILLYDIPVRVMKLTICIMTCRIAWWHLHSACWHSNPVKSYYNYNITNFTLFKYMWTSFNECFFCYNLHNFPIFIIKFEIWRGRIEIQVRTLRKMVEYTGKNGPVHF